MCNIFPFFSDSDLPTCLDVFLPNGRVWVFGTIILQDAFCFGVFPIFKCCTINNIMIKLIFSSNQAIYFKFLSIATFFYPIYDFHRVVNFSLNSRSSFFLKISRFSLNLNLRAGFKQVIRNC